LRNEQKLNCIAVHLQKLNKAAEIFARTVVEKIDAVMNDKGYYTAKENHTVNKP